MIYFSKIEKMKVKGVIQKSPKSNDHVEEHSRNRSKKNPLQSRGSI